MKLATMQHGPHKGLYTLFMTSDEALVFFSYPSLKERVTPAGSAATIEQVKHIYIAQTQGDYLDYDEACLATWKTLGLVVTYEVSHLTGFWRTQFDHNVHFVLRIARYVDYSQIDALKSGDEILFTDRGGRESKSVVVRDLTVSLPDEHAIEFTAMEA